MRSQSARIRLPRTGALAELTGRELEVLQRLANGKAPKEIARDLFISPKTVASHVQHILGKLGAHSRVEAVAIAYREGLVESAVGNEAVQGHLSVGA
jgi:DNA-binding NarL/FixJ family response regulator